MFRLIVNIGGAFDLYVSRSASDDLRAFTSPTGLGEGYFENLYVDFLRFAPRADYGRSRHLILLTEGSISDGERERIRSYLERGLSRQFDRIIAAINRDDVAGDRKEIYDVCETLDYNLVQVLSTEESLHYNDSGRDSDIGEPQNTVRPNEWAGGVEAHIDVERESVDEMASTSTYDSSSEAEVTAKKVGSHEKEGTSRGGFSFGVRVLILMLFFWSVTVSIGLVVVYLELGRVVHTVGVVREHVESLIGVQPGESSETHIGKLASELALIRDSIGGGDDGVIENPFVEGILSLSGHVAELRSEMVHDEGTLNKGTFVEAVDTLEERLAGLVEDRILTSVKEEMMLLNQEMKTLRVEVRKLVDVESRESSARRINGLIADVGRLQSKIRMLTDPNDENSLTSTVAELEGQIRAISIAVLYYVDGKACEAIQDALVRGGYYTGDVDGICRGQTATGIRAFQEDKGLKVTGSLTGEEVRKLLNPGEQERE